MLVLGGLTCLGRASCSNVEDVFISRNVASLCKKVTTSQIVFTVVSMSCKCVRQSADVNLSTVKCLAKRFDVYNCWN